MGKITLTDESGRTYTATFDDTPGTGGIDGVETGLAVSALQERLNSESTLCESDFHFELSNFGRDSFRCVQPDSLSGPGGIVSGESGAREVHRVRLHLEKEVRTSPVNVGGVELGPLTPVSRDVEVTVRFVPGGQYGSIQLLGITPVETPPVAPPAPEPPGPDLGDAIASAAHGIGNFFSGVATRLSSAGSSAVQSLRSYFA